MWLGALPSQPMRHREVRKKGQKWNLKLWVIKELKTDGSIELEEPYSRRTKVVTRRFVQ